METGTVFDTRSGQPRTSEENIKCVRQAFQRSPMKSICTAARQLELPHSTVHKVLHKNLRLYAYKGANFTGTSAKGHAKSKRICSEHVLRATNGAHIEVY